MPVLAIPEGARVITREIREATWIDADGARFHADALSEQEVDGVEKVEGAEIVQLCQPCGGAVREVITILVHSC